MTVINFTPTSVYSINECLNKNNIEHFWIYKNDICLGSIMPKMYKTELKYDVELNTLEVTLYINREGYLCKENVMLNAAEIKDYTFYYL